MELKKGTFADVMLLQKISIETFTDTFKEKNTVEDLKRYLETAYTVDQLKKELSNENSIFLFLQNNEETVGYLKLNVEDAQTEESAENAMEIERIYVRSHYKRKGYGKFLIEQAELFAQKENKKAIWLGVWEENAAALAFYKDRGFVQKSSHSFFMGDDEQTDLIMTKRLL